MNSIYLGKPTKVEMTRRYCRVRRRRCTLINMTLWLLFVGTFTVGLMYGYIEIHFDNTAARDGSPRLEDEFGTAQNNDYKNLLRDPSIAEDIHDLFKHFREDRLEILKEIEPDKAKSMIKLREKEWRLVNERKLLNKKHDNSTTPDPQYTNDEEEMQERKSSTFVDRHIMVKYLKTEKYLLRKRHGKFNSIHQIGDISEFPKLWRIYNSNIDEISLTRDPVAINNTLEMLSKEPIIKCREKSSGTQIKIQVKLSDSTRALVKPMKVNRDYETPPDHYYFSDFERHHAEIAAFHLDRLLGFYRIPPTSGRLFNITRDFWEKTDEYFASTFYYSPAGNVCFHGHCDYYCDSNHAICGRPVDRLEGSIQIVLPLEDMVSWKAVTNPYKRSYSKKEKAIWEEDPEFCLNTVYQDVFYQSKHLLDLMDTTVFDFLTSNMDRHSTEQFVGLGEFTFKMHLDNGRAFGKIKTDEMSILEPIKQCCLIRYSTFLKLKELHEKKLSKLMDESLKADPLYPILTEGHLNSLDRRLIKIFLQLHKCIIKHSAPRVIIDDGY